MDLSSLKRIQAFMELLQQSKQEGIKPSFVYTPTEHGENINVTVTIEGKQEPAGILFWDVGFLQDNELADILDEDDIALGLNLTDGLIEDAENILQFVNSKLEQFG